MSRLMQILTVFFAMSSFALVGCGGGTTDGDGDTDHADQADHDHDDHADHDHDGDDHDHDHDHADDDDHDHDHDHADDDDHDHGHGHDDEESLGSATIDGMKVEAWQGHGDVEAGKELHIALRVADLDNDQATIRVWIGTSDRFESVVEKADYDADEDRWMAHAVAPDPLPQDVHWWIEIVTPDGTSHVGSMMIH